LEFEETLIILGALAELPESRFAKQFYSQVGFGVYNEGYYSQSNL
jgi:hypothetical protein